jgi:hypothetical protein
MTSNYVMLINNEFRRMLKFGHTSVKYTITDIAGIYGRKFQNISVRIGSPSASDKIKFIRLGNRDHNSNYLLMLNVLRSSFNNINIILDVKPIIYTSTKIYCVYF